MKNDLFPSGGAGIAFFQTGIGEKGDNFFHECPIDPVTFPGDLISLELNFVLTGYFTDLFLLVEEDPDHFSFQ